MCLSNRQFCVYTSPMEDKEIKALIEINSAFADLEPEAVERVLEYVAKKHGITKSFSKRHEGSQEQVKNDPLSGISLSESEIPGIATLSDSGQFKLTVRDFKAKNTRDAAIRILLVTVWSYMKLTNDPSVSSKLVVKPQLEAFRAYSGNTRQAIADHRGIIRNGDALSLDAHARDEAEKYVEEILDDSISGSWKPSSGVNRRKKTNKKDGGG